MLSLRRFFVCMVILVASTAGAGAVSATAQAAPNPPGWPGGGVWVHPAAPVAEWGFEPMVIAVQVRNSAWVNHIDVTGTWPGSGWHVLCSGPVQPDDRITYTCTFDPQAAGVPPLTEMSLSFDVYGTGTPPPSNLSPNGVHKVSWGWGCIYTPPTGGCNGW
jgi:hypothetical protein